MHFIFKLQGKNYPQELLQSHRGLRLEAPRAEAAFLNVQEAFNAYAFLRARQWQIVIAPQTSSQLFAL